MKWFRRETISDWVQVVIFAGISVTLENLWQINFWKASAISFCAGMGVLAISRITND